MSQIWVMDDLTYFPLEGEAFENTTKQPSVGLDGAAGVDGAAQIQPPKEKRILLKPPEKKRRRTVEQVRRLEASFNVNNRLKQHQKFRLAKELGLDPRQVELWFKNRRARTRGKRLETEFNGLKYHYNSLKADFDRLLMEKERLQNEVSMLSNGLNPGNEEKSNPGSMNGSKSSVEGNKLLVAPGPPSQEEEDPLKGLGLPSMEPEFGFGQTEGDAFDSAFGENFDFVLSGIDDQVSFWCSELGL